MKITPEILAALDHVRQFHPEVCLVVFNQQGQWQYMSEDFDSPKWDNTSPIDTSILEAAADSVEVFPAVFQLEDEEDNGSLTCDGCGNAWHRYLVNEHEDGRQYCEHCFPEVED